MNETMLVKGVAKCAHESTEECQAMECCYQCARYKAMVAKLAAYESTGLTPEEVASLRAKPKNAEEPLELDSFGEYRRRHGYE